MAEFIPISMPSITQKEIAYVNDAVSSGWVSSLGKYIGRFEEAFAAFCGTKYALTTSNGTTGLHLALVSLGIGANDEVIIPDLTFVATANAITYAGAKVVAVDIEDGTLCINPQRIRAAITDKTTAIIPVHLYGQPANMPEIMKIAGEYNLTVIEDAAEAHGAEINGKKVGALGKCGVFSFYGNKIITSGEGGMITTDDPKLYEKAKFLRDHAMSPEKRYWHSEVGYNYRMTNIQAALGAAQLERIDAILLRKKEIFEMYNRELSGIEGVRLNRACSWAKNVFWMVCLELEGFSAEGRDLFMLALKAKGIDSRPYFCPISEMPMYQSGAILNPVAHQISRTGLNLPSYYDISDKQIRYICQNVKDILDSVRSGKQPEA